MHWLKRKLAEGMIRRSLKERDLPPHELEARHQDPGNPLFNDNSTGIVMKIEEDAAV